MTALRFLAGLFMLAAAMVLASDVTRPMMGNASFVSTSLGRHWAETAPKSLAASRAAIMQRVGNVAWDGVVAPVLRIPTFAFLGGIAVLCGYLGRRRRKVDIYVN